MQDAVSKWPSAARPRCRGGYHALIRLYHERWEHEIAYLALRHTLLNGRVLRSKDPAGLEQEIWALLTLYQALRREMVTAVETVPGADVPGAARRRPAGARRAAEAAEDPGDLAVG